MRAVFGRFDGVFIRAPGIEQVDTGVEVLGVIKRRATAAAGGDSEEVVAVRQGWTLGTTFHPELTGDVRWHQYFMDMVRDFYGQRQNGKIALGH